MPSIHSLTVAAALALSLAIPFAGAYASDDCTEVASIKSASKGDKIAPATDSKNLAEGHIASLPGDAAVKLPAQAKTGRDLGQSQTAVPSTGKKATWPKAFQKYKGHCC